MKESDEKVRSDPDAKQDSIRPRTPPDSSYYEAPEIEGWALQWDTTALRKTHLARKMRSLRQASSDQ